MGEVYGFHNVSLETVCRWRTIFYANTESVKDAAKSERPVTATDKNDVSKVRETIESDGRYTVRDIANAITGVSLARVHFIQTRILKVKKFFYQMDTHLLKDEHIRVCVQTANCFQRSPKGNYQTLSPETRHGCTITSLIEIKETGYG